MDTLYDELTALQSLPNAYAEWAEYRKALSGFIIESTGEKTTASIIGAGACNDFDLKRLTAHFSKLTLIDRNMQAVRDGVRKQRCEPDKIQVMRADILGISDDAYRDFCNALMQKLVAAQADCSEAADFGEMFLSLMNGMLDKRKPDDLVRMGASADYIICCGVHSQLLNLFPQMAGVYKRYIDFDIAKVFETVSTMNRTIASQTNTAIIELARKGAVLGLEEQRVGVPGGIEGAAQALDDVRKRGIVPVKEIRLVWPFDRSQQKNYGIRCMSVNTSRFS